MVILHRGLSLVNAKNFTKSNNPSKILASSNGEFGVGSYYWLDDLPAAILSATQYYGNKGDWAVIKLEFDEQSLHQIMQPKEGYGPSVIEFKHKKTSPFKDAKQLTSRFIVPKEYSHLHKDPFLKTGSPHSGSFGIMEAKNFRIINADPEKFGIEGESNNISWQYDIIIGTSAVLYSDENLVQVKFANKGLTFLNNLTLVTRLIVIKGSQIKKKWKMVSAWKMQDRRKIFEKYFKDKSQVDLDT